MRLKTFKDKLGCFFATKEIYEDKPALVRLYKYFIIGLIPRILFLPFLFQRDVLSTYQRAAETVFAGNFGADFQQFLTHAIHSIYLFILQAIFPFVGEYREILLDQNTLTSWVNFINSDNIFAILVLFKGIYLIFDIACMFLLLRIFYDGDINKKLLVFKYWVFNPLVIFVLYIFARHDVIGILITLIALLLAKKGRKYWAIIFLALAVAIRFFPIMILPLAIIYLANRKKDYILLCGVGLSGLVGIETFSYLYFGDSVIFSLLNTQHFDYIISSAIDLVIHDRIFIFIAAYTIVILSFQRIKDRNFSHLLTYSAMIYLIYVGTSYFHPQYMLWAVPFLVFLFVKDRSLVVYHWIQFALLMVILLYWGDLVTKFVFAPIDPKFAIYLTGPVQIIRRFYDPVKFVNIFRSVFSGVSLWMVYVIISNMRKEDKLRTKENDQ